MTDTEFWEKVAPRVRGWWQHSPLSQPSLALMFDDLRDFPVEQVLVALTAMQRDGREHAPNSGQIRAKLIDLDVDAPEWAEVARAVKACMSFPERRYVADRGFVNEREQRLEREPELVRQFVRHVGWDEASQVTDPDDRQAEAQIRNKWLQFVARDKGDRALAGLPSAGLARLERVNDERRQVGVGVLKQIEGGSR